MTNSKIRIFAGAGISAESGLATFRDTGGIWTQYDVDEVCNYQVFKRSKEDNVKRKHIFDFYNEVKKAVLKAEPNDAHRKIAQWQKTYGKENVKIYTANVDDLFERAGCEDVCHVHGELYNMHCAACGKTWDIGLNQYNHEDRCPHCNSRLTKPNIVFFYEAAPMYEILQRDFNVKRGGTDDLMMYIGSSMSVIPPSRLLHDKRNKTRNVVVNLEPQTEDDWFGHQYYGKATEQLEKIEKELLMNFI